MQIRLVGRSGPKLIFFIVLYLIWIWRIFLQIYLLYIYTFCGIPQCQNKPFVVSLIAQIYLLWYSSVPKSTFCSIPQCPNYLLWYSSMRKSTFCGIPQYPNLPFVVFASAQKPFRKYWLFHAGLHLIDEKRAKMYNRVVEYLVTHVIWA